MTSQFSDTANTDNPEHVTITGKVLVYEYHVDAEGYVLMRPHGTIRNPREGEVVGDEGGAETVPFDRAEIVWPVPGWPVGRDGRGLSVLEVSGAQALRAEERRTAVHVREYLSFRKVAA